MSVNKPFWWVKGAEILDVFWEPMDNPLNTILISCWEVAVLLFSELFIKRVHLQETWLSFGVETSPSFNSANAAYEHIWVM